MINEGSIFIFFSMEVLKQNILCRGKHGGGKGVSISRSHNNKRVGECVCWIYI